MNAESGEESMNDSEPGQNDDGQTTGTTAILGLSPATHFLLQSLPRPDAAELPEQFVLSESWGGVRSGHSHEEAEGRREPWEEHLRERTGTERTVTPP